MTVYHNGANNTLEGPPVLSLRPEDAVRKIGSKELCGRGSVIWYDKHSKCYLCRYFCKRWDHPPCAAYKERCWLAKAKVHDHLWTGVIDAAGFQNLRKKIVRQKGDYFSARSDEQAFFVSTVPIDGFSPVSSHDDLASMLHPWLVPTTEVWGRRKKVSHSRGWGLPQDDESNDPIDDSVTKGSADDDNHEVMGQNGQVKMLRLVLVEPPKDVIEVLAHLSSRVKGDVEDLVAPPSEESSRSALATLYLSKSAVELLDLLARGQKDPEDRLHLAWAPKMHDSGPHDDGSMSALSL